jgi:CRISPR/Cas system CMR-associated protein Cmr5 small subunit
LFHLSIPAAYIFRAGKLDEEKNVENEIGGSGCKQFISMIETANLSKGVYFFRVKMGTACALDRLSLKKDALQLKLLYLACEYTP